MSKYVPKLKNIAEAVNRLKGVCGHVPLQLNAELSQKHSARIYLQREDLGPVRSYKLRGAYNKMAHLGSQSVVTCSAGNHAQGVAFSCRNLDINGIIFMPNITTQQKINKVKQFGGKKISIFLDGNNFDESFEIANAYAKEHNRNFIHPFDDEKVIEGQATVGYDIVKQMDGKSIDYLFLPVGGGGLSAGVSSYIKMVSPNTKIIGVEPLGAPSMFEALKAGRVVKLDKINSFVDGASVKKVGELNFPICQQNLDDILLIDEGHVCSKIIQMYNDNGFIIEPAGVLSLCALDIYPEIKGKNVVSVISGGNSDVFRMPEILEKSLVYEGLKHYFKVQFAQKAGSLKDFILNVLGPNDDIIYFRYTRAINKETAPVVIGIQLREKHDINLIMINLMKKGFVFEKLDGLGEE
jgi:threonine dehydratase